MATRTLESSTRRLVGKVALITGGASGIGAATARLFAHHGAKLVVADIQDTEGRSLASTVGASYVHCDVADEAHVAAAVDAAVSTYGHLDVVFANAGIADFPYTPLASMDWAVFDRTMAVNVTGVALALKHAARVMVPLKRGSVVATASVAGFMGGITPHAYTCSKHAVLGLVRNAAAELATAGVRVNAVSPYGLASKATCSAFGIGPEEVEEYMRERATLKRATLKADDIAEAVLYLASDEAKYVSGHNLVVDGGFLVINSTFIPFDQYINK